MNKKGFTLVEIIVSIAVGSVALLVAGSIFLDSMHFFSNVSYSDLDKRLLDTLVSFVRDEVEYSTDVRLMLHNDSQAPEISEKSGWHCFYVKDNVLYRDNKQLFSNDFYNHKKLVIIAKGNYQNKMRVDLTYQLFDDKEEVYSSRDTIMFLNVKVSDEIMDNGLFNKNADVQLSDAITENYTGYALYYKKEFKNTSQSGNTNQSSGTGTVKDQLELITLLNNRGEYRSNTIYYRGDYVFYEGYWWVYIDNKDYEWGPVAPGVDTTHRWKKIDMNWDSRSGYQTGDIVIYHGKYYKCTSELLVAKYDIIVPGEYYEWKDARLLWQELPNYSSNEKNLIECNVPSSIINIKEKTVLNKLNNIDLNTIPTYDGINSHYDCVNNKYVKIEMGNSGIYEYFVKIFDNLGEPNQKVYNSKTEKFEVGWQKLSLDYDENSAYVNGDVVYTGNYRSYIIATLNAGQIFEYDNFGKLVSINPDNAGKINFYIPLDQCYSNYSNKYNQWWIHYNN